LKKIGVTLLALVILISPLSLALTMNNIFIPESESRAYSAGPGSQTTLYIYANNQRIAKQENNEIYFYHNDHLGSPRIITDKNGNIIEEIDYLPFGSSFNKDEKISYNSKELDSDTGLNYYGARYYGSSLGRFITSDTVKGRLTDSQSLNLYVYTKNNPMKYVDPTGNQEKWIERNEKEEPPQKTFDDYVNYFHKTLEKNKSEILMVSSIAGVPKESIMAGFLSEDLRCYTPDLITIIHNKKSWIRSITPNWLLNVFGHKPNPGIGRSAYGMVHTHVVLRAVIYLNQLDNLDEGTRGLINKLKEFSPNSIDEVFSPIEQIALTQKAHMEFWKRAGFDIFNHKFNNIKTFGERVGILITLNSIAEYYSKEIIIDPNMNPGFYNRDFKAIIPHNNPQLGGTKIWQGGKFISYGEIAQKYVDEKYSAKYFKD